MFLIHLQTELLDVDHREIKLIDCEEFKGQSYRYIELKSAFKSVYMDII